MFFKKRKQVTRCIGQKSDKARVEELRKRLAEISTDGTATNFNSNAGEINPDGSIEFDNTVGVNPNYEVTEWSDITQVDPETREAFEKAVEEFEGSKNDYWSTR